MTDVKDAVVLYLFGLLALGGGAFLIPHFVGQIRGGRIDRFFAPMNRSIAFDEAPARFVVHAGGWLSSSLFALALGVVLLIEVDPPLLGVATVTLLSTLGAARAWQARRQPERGRLEACLDAPSPSSAGATYRDGAPRVPAEQLAELGRSAAALRRRIRAAAWLGAVGLAPAPLVALAARSLAAPAVALVASGIAAVPAVTALLLARAEGRSIDALVARAQTLAGR